MLLYHLSPYRFDVIRVSKSISSFKRVWLCEIQMCDHIAVHLLKTLGKRVKYVYTVELDFEDVSRFKLGIYTTKYDVYPKSRKMVRTGVLDELVILHGTENFIN